jgi:hypothetical protein
MKDRRISESKLFRESYMYSASGNSQKRYLIAKEWFETWMSFLYGHRDECPDQIDNSKLLQRI